MTERGNTTHGQHVDDKMKQESQALGQGGRSGHAEEWRETEPLPDDTDSREVREAIRENLPEAPDPAAENPAAGDPDQRAGQEQ